MLGFAGPRELTESFRSEKTFQIIESNLNSARCTGADALCKQEHLPLVLSACRQHPLARATATSELALVNPGGLKANWDRQRC